MKRTDMAGRSVSSSAGIEAGFYDRNEAYIRDELELLDLLLHIHILLAFSGQTPDPLDPLKGLVLSENAMLRLLQHPADRFPALEEPSRMKELAELQIRFQELTAKVRERKQRSLENGVWLALPQLAERFHLSEAEEKCLLICLAPELDSKYEKIYAYLQDDVTRNKPSIELVLKLLCTSASDRMDFRKMFDPQAPLMKYQLLQLPETGYSVQTLSGFLAVDPQIVRFVLGIRETDPRLAPAVQRADAGNPVPEWMPIRQDWAERIGSIIRSEWNKREQERKKLIFALSGPHGSGKRMLAENVCRDLGLPLIIADAGKLKEHPLSFAQALFLVCRDAYILQAALCITGMEQLFENDRNAKNFAELILEQARQFSSVTFLLSAHKWNIPNPDEGTWVFGVPFEVPDAAARKEVWSRIALQEPFAESVDLDLIAEKFRLTPRRIWEAVQLAKQHALWRTGEIRISAEDLHQACLSQSSLQLGTLADKIKPERTLREIILPREQKAVLEQLIGQVKYRRIVHDEWGFKRKLSRGRGIHALLHGPPGTGKTTAAEAIAYELGLELYRIDLSQAVSKYIGETEKNIQRIFQEASESFSILFFDEADALFGKRTEVKDAHDRHANTEIAYLLQKMEEYDGITILATNLYSNLDEAFIRRMQFTVHFPLPDEEHRELIWRSMFPKEAPLSETVDFPFLAKQFKLSGGHIKNIVLAAAFMAAERSEEIRMEHIIRSLKREMDKIGKIALKEDFGVYSNML